jgi:hypothetical protein
MKSVYSDCAPETEKSVNFIISKYCKDNVIFLHCRVVNSAFRELEPYEVKVSRTVLRGQRRSNPPELPDINARRKVYRHN